MEPTCRLAQRALIAGEVSPDLEAHIEGCERCGRARRLSEFLVARSRGTATGTIDKVFVPGQELLGYRLDGVVGSGGQGVVFKATEVDVPGSVVALKIVHHDRTDQSVREVSYAKRINHPNVCRVNTTKVHGKFRLIEMEFIEGGTLASRLVAQLSSEASGGDGAGLASPATPPLSDVEKVAVFRGVLDGLEAVHKKEILHLDLKPRNVLLRDSTSPVVTDFGMSAQAGGEGLGGTTGWSAPEIDQGTTPDVRADVYSAGALLSALYPKPSDDVARVIGRARAQAREDRYPSIVALRAAFDATVRETPKLAADEPLDPRGGAASATPARSSRLAALVAVGLAVAAAGVLGAVSLGRGAKERSLNLVVDAGATATTGADGLGVISLGAGYEVVDAVDFRDPGSDAPPFRVEASRYLLQHGLSVADVSPPESRVILAKNASFYSGDAVSGADLSSLTQDGTGNAPASFTLVLATAVDRVDITLPGLIAATESGITHPAWSVHALDAEGHELSSHSEGLPRHFDGVPPRTYTLEAPAPAFARIAKLRFLSDPQLDGKPFAAFSAVLVGRIVLSRRH